MLVNVTIYGKLAQSHGGKHLAIIDLSMPSSTNLGDLLQKLEIPIDQTSFIFLDAVLCDVPGLTVTHTELLKDGSHVGIFSIGYMWPYQYRHGMPMSEPLKKEMQKHGVLHHTYSKQEV